MGGLLTSFLGGGVRCRHGPLRGMVCLVYLAMLRMCLRDSLMLCTEDLLRLTLCPLAQRLPRSCRRKCQSGMTCISDASRLVELKIVLLFELVSVLD